MNPHLHEQASFIDVKVPSGLARYARIDPDPNVCNTTLCIAGATQFVTNGKAGLKKFTSDDPRVLDDGLREAGELLGLDIRELNALFYTFDEEKSLKMLAAVANGDEEKFEEIYYGRN